MRCQTSLVPHGQPIIRPKVSETLDYEAELIVVIGKRAKHLTMANASSCIAGYSCGNEGSVREFQRKTTQWDMGKNFDRTGGFGPWMVTADEVPPGGKGLKIETRLNGQVMQSDNTDNMMFPVAETLVYVTQGMTLEPGDVIVTGTPSGVGFARKPAGLDEARRHLRDRHRGRRRAGQSDRRRERSAAGFAGPRRSLQLPSAIGARSSATVIRE